MRRISFSAKCDDRFGGTITIDGKHYELDGYVPDGLGIGGGDYVRITIDLDTGTIVGFAPPTDDAINEVLETATELTD